jgi:dienelactone hydrolase
MQKTVFAAGLALLLAAPLGAAAVQPSQPATSPAPNSDGLLTEPGRAFGATPRGVVIIAPDAVGRDGRAAPYVEAMHRHGFATLELVTADDPPKSLADLDVAFVEARRRIAADPRLAALPVALLGFGEGGRAALAWTGRLPVVALYPRCASVESLPLAESSVDRAPLLLLHPGQDPTDAAGACQRLVDGFGPGGFRHAYRDTTPGWDIPPVGSIAGPTLQPRDVATYAGGQPPMRYRAEYRQAVSMDAARRAAWFISAAFERRGPWTPPRLDP